MKLCQLSGLVKQLLVVACALQLAWIAGCDDSYFLNQNLLPAPLRDDFPYELRGQPMGIFGGDNFQLEWNGGLHYIVIEGVDTPKPGEKNFEASRSELIRLINFQPLRLCVIGRDSQEREIAFVYLPKKSLGSTGIATDDDEEIDVGKEMIRRGFGWYDGNEFEAAVQYQTAEQNAKTGRVGIWSDGESRAE